jgi:hypothetical protein
MEDLKWNWFQILYHEIQWEFEVGPIGKVAHYVQIKPHAMCGYFWASGKYSF